MSTISWLHISDMHIFKQSPADMQKQELALRGVISFLKENKWRDITKPQYVFVTGDIAFAGKQENYSANDKYSGYKFLNEVADELGISKDDLVNRVFMVAGNHEAERTKLIDEYEQVNLNLAINSDKLSDAFLKNSIACQNILKRFTEYHNFYNSFYNNSSPSDIKDTLWYKKTFPLNGKKLHIAGLCSAFLCQSRWLVDGKKEDYQEGIEHLTLCEGMVNKYFEGVNENDFTFALMHHDYSRTADHRGTIRTLLEDKCDFILMGHDHKEGWAEPIGGKCHKIRAGSLYENTTKHRNAFNLGELNIETGKVKMQTIHLRPDKNSYKWSVDKDADPTKGKPDQYYKFDPLTGLLTFTLKAVRTPMPIIKDKVIDLKDSAKADTPESRGVFGRENNISELSKLFHKKSIVTTYGMSGIGKSRLISEVLKKIKKDTDSYVLFPVNEKMELSELYRLLAPSIGMTEENPKPPPSIGGIDFTFLRKYASRTIPCFIHLDKAHLLLGPKGFCDRDIKVFLEGVTKNIPSIRIILECREEPPRDLFEAAIYGEYHVRGLGKSDVRSYFRRPYPDSNSIGWNLSNEDAEMICQYLGSRDSGKQANPLGMVLLAAVADGRKRSPVEILKNYEFKEEYTERLKTELFNDLYKNVLNDDERRMLRICSLYRDYIPGSHLDYLDKLVGSKTEPFNHLRRRCLLNAVGMEEKFYLHAMIAELTQGLISDNDPDFCENHKQIGNAWLQNLELKGRPTLEKIFKASEAVYHLTQAGQYSQLDQFRESVLLGNAGKHLIDHLESESRRLYKQEKHEDNIRVLELLASLQPGVSKTHSFWGLSIERLKGEGQEDALEHFRIAYNLDRSQPKWLANLGQCLLARNKPDEYVRIVDELEPSVREKVIDDYCVSIYCRCVEKIGDAGKASSLRKEQIEAGSRDWAFYNDEAKYLLNSGKAGEAMEILDKARQAGAENDFTLAIRANVLERLGDKDKASILRKEQIEAGSCNAAFYNDEAKYLRNTGKAREAMEILDKARRAGAEDDFSLSIRASVLEKLGDSE